MNPLRALWVMDHLGMPGGVMHGATRYFLNVIPRLSPDLVRVTLCFLGPRHPIEAQLRARGVEPIFFQRQRWDWRSLGDVHRLARRVRPDLMHLGGMKSMIVGRVVARAVGARAVIHLHDLNRNAAPIAFLHRRLAAWTDLAIGVSQEAARYAVEAFGIPAERSVALPNGVPLDDFAHIRPEERTAGRADLGIPADAAVVTVVGRLFPIKSQDLLIAQMPAIRRRCPHAVLLLVGDGESRAALEAQARALGLLGNTVLFAGQHDDLPRMLAVTDLLALPTRSGEGFPMAALEAMAAARPVIAFANGGMPEIIDDGATGALVPPGRDEAFGQRVADLLLDPGQLQRLGAAAAVSVQRFSIDHHVRRLQQCYLDLAGPRTTPVPAGGAIVL